MAKLTIALSAALAASASAFAPSSVSRSATALNAEKIWDPLSLYNLEDVNDTFPNMFPKPAFLDEAEIKHGRMAMLAWTGVWATHVVSLDWRQSHWGDCEIFFSVMTWIAYLISYQLTGF
jgi:hypothetical protein